MTATKKTGKGAKDRTRAMFDLDPTILVAFDMARQAAGKNRSAYLEEILSEVLSKEIAAVQPFVAEAEKAAKKQAKD